MASIGHIAVGVAAGRWYVEGLPRVTSQPWHKLRLLGGWMLGFVALSLLPDLDVIGFSYGISYGDPWGHRGASHSFAAAIFLGSLVGAAAWRLDFPLRRTILFAICVTASHGLLDTMTDGGLGIGLLWPFSYERFFAPWRPIPVSPMGRHFFSPYGFSVALTEFFYFFPCFVYAFWPRRNKHHANPET